MQTINERFKMIVRLWFKGNNFAFARAMGRPSSSFNKVINGDVEPRAKTLQSVCEKLPRLNPTWLLTGEGDIERKKETSSAETRDYEAIIKAKEEEVKAKDELIATLKQYVADLRASGAGRS